MATKARKTSVKKAAPKKLNPGTYTGLSIVKTEVNKYGQLQLTLNFDKAIKRLEEKETIPEAGSQAFSVYCDRLGIYTTIGADNRHHASNKATKLFGPHWSAIRDKYQARNEFKFCTVKEFGDLIRTLQY